MSRPIKQGIDYFPMDVDLDGKFEFIEAKHGITGFGVIVKLYQRIYKEGYFLKWSDETALLFSKKVGVNIDEINAILEDCFKYDIFSNRVFSRNKVLTSSGIQKRFVSAITRRKEVYLCKSLIVIDVNSLINVNINWVNADNKTQSKGKKSIVKESIAETGELITKIIEEFKIAHGSYEIIDFDEERKAATKILEIYKKKYLDSNDEDTLIGLRFLFDKYVQIDNDWMRCRMSLPFMVKNWNTINKMLKDGKTKDAGVKAIRNRNDPVTMRTGGAVIGDVLKKVSGDE